MSRRRSTKVCDKNCFECPFEDCIYDELDLEDVKEQRARDAEHKAALKSEKELWIAAKKKAYYEANREDIAAYQKAYYEANREELSVFGMAIKAARKAHGYTQADLAELVGCCRSLIGHMETGIIPPTRAELFDILPELKEAASV